MKIIMKNDLSSVTQIEGISDSTQAEACYNVKWDRQRFFKYKQITMPGDTLANGEISSERNPFLYAITNKSFWIFI